MEKFGEQVPETINFGIGYFEAGKQSKKRWLCCREDLEAMYSCHSKGDEIILWCESRSTQINKRKREDDASTSTSKRQTKESEVDAVYETLKTKHVDKFDNPKLRLWARMVVGGLHESTDEPPDIPAFQGGVKKKKGSTIDAFSGVVEAFAKVVERTTPHSHASPPAANCSVNDATPGVSPAKAANLRMKNFEQLRYLHGLFEDNIISEQELVEQKRIVLDALKKIT